MKPVTYNARRKQGRYRGRVGYARLHNNNVVIWRDTSHPYYGSERFLQDTAHSRFTSPVPRAQ